METNIRQATLTDVDTLVRFNRAIAEETEGKELPHPVVSAGVRSVFEDPSRGFYVVAEVDGDPVGSVLVTHEWSDWRNAYYWLIQSVYVRPEHRKRGIYRALHRYVEQMARSAGNVCGLRLYVDGENSVAKTVYVKLGMVKSRYDLLESAGFTEWDRHEDG
jgi:GNAT superfamily N-acetyltransferase